MDRWETTSLSLSLFFCQRNWLVTLWTGGWGAGANMRAQEERERERASSRERETANLDSWVKRCRQWWPSTTNSPFNGWPNQRGPPTTKGEGVAATTTTTVTVKTTTTQQQQRQQWQLSAAEWRKMTGLQSITEHTSFLKLFSDGRAFPGNWGAWIKHVQIKTLWKCLPSTLQFPHLHFFSCLFYAKKSVTNFSRLFAGPSAVSLLCSCCGRRWIGGDWEREKRAVAAIGERREVEREKEGYVAGRGL